MKPSVRQKSLIRALDANCNRAREGLRVAEDVARFLWDDPALLKRLKRLRHAVTQAEKSLLKSAKGRAAARDVEKDLGRGTREKSEKKRSSPEDLLRANLKRAQEALRSLEEFSKLLGSPICARFKKIRYECYRVEESL
ncbi:MAG TPA: thiamine-phosphate pyrophosphorylase [bacterium]|nr:thiamine-phosphate pyrophosphorylase [bacterium]